MEKVPSMTLSIACDSRHCGSGSGTTNRNQEIGLLISWAAKNCAVKSNGAHLRSSIHTDLSSTVATVKRKESAFELEPRTARRFATLKSAGAVLGYNLSRIELELFTQDVGRSGN